LRKTQASVYVLNPRNLTLSEIDCRKEKDFTLDIIKKLTSLHERKTRVGALLRSKFLKRLDEAKEGKEEEEETKEEDEEFDAVDGVLELDTIQTLQVKQSIDLRRLKSISWMKPPTKQHRENYHRVSFAELSYPDPMPLRVWKDIELKLKASMFSTRRRYVTCELKLDVKSGIFCYKNVTDSSEWITHRIGHLSPIILQDKNNTTFLLKPIAQKPYRNIKLRNVRTISYVISRMCITKYFDRYPMIS